MGRKLLIILEINDEFYEKQDPMQLAHDELTAWGEYRIGAGGMLIYAKWEDAK